MLFEFLKAPHTSASPAPPEGRILVEFYGHKRSLQKLTPSAPLSQIDFFKAP